jgi:hypothetical protein
MLNLPMNFIGKFAAPKLNAATKFKFVKDAVATSAHDAS